MRIRDIKYKASQIVYDNRDILWQTCFVIGTISTIGSFLGESIGSIMLYIVMILTLTLSHGYVVMGLKAVNGKGHMVSPVEDGLVGFRRFKELFSTYFIYSFLSYMILFISALLLLVLLFSTSMDLIYSIFSTYVNGGVAALGNVYISTAQVEMLVYSLLMVAIIILAIGMIYDCFFGFTPYILEKYGITGVAAMKESASTMKGFRVTYIALHLSYFGWMILQNIALMVVTNVFDIPLITPLIGMVLGVVMYLAKLKVSVAILYEEADLAKSVNNNGASQGYE